MHIFFGSSVTLPLVFRRLQIELARDMGYTAARYGHVMFPENAYEPALALAELLLEGVGKGKFTFVHFLVLFSFTHDTIWELDCFMLEVYVQI